mmetsp:Transcript_36292/g.85129  ORF Transcript_36292/g.85129 Transcript_36292/m.85129 type:complete len:213 (-) Transcript_36292:57-695(-)
MNSRSTRHLRISGSLARAFMYCSRPSLRSTISAGSQMGAVCTVREVDKHTSGSRTFSWGETREAAGGVGIRGKRVKSGPIQVPRRCEEVSNCGLPRLSGHLHFGVTLVNLIQLLVQLCKLAEPLLHVPLIIIVHHAKGIPRVLANEAQQAVPAPHIVRLPKKHPHVVFPLLQALAPVLSPLQTLFLLPRVRSSTANDRRHLFSSFFPFLFLR